MAERNEVNYSFMKKIVQILNAGQSRVITLTGNIFDLFFSSPEDNYVPIISFLLSRWDKPEINEKFIKVVYELNGPVKFVDDNDLKAVKEAWMKLHAKFGIDLRIEKLVRPWSAEKEEKKVEKEFDDILRQTAENSIFAFEFLRQLCLTSRFKIEGKSILNKNLIILIEGADVLIPSGEISRLSEADRKRIAICRDWFCDPEFMNSNDSVIFITESKSKLNEEVSHLPQLLEVEIDSPDEEQRKDFISWFIKKQPEDKKPKLWTGGSQKELACLTAGLSIQALMQLLKDKGYSGEKIETKDIVSKVSEYVINQLGGNDVADFYRPKHKIADAVGNTKLGKFLKEKFIPRIKTKEGCISGAIVCGPIGSGKTFIFEAVAGELGIPVLVLKNLRSKWFGETDVIFERLRRCLESLSKVLIFVDEADTQFGGVSQDVHETERRLTGKIQAMMSDVRLRGRVIWLLMTARINLLSQDIRRPGRCGDYIIPVLDPVGEDLKAFVKFVLKPVKKSISDELLSKVIGLTEGYYAAAFACLKDDMISVLKEKKQEELTDEQILEIISDRILQNGGITRKMQMLYALLNCSHKSLLPDDVQDISKAGEKWQKELDALGRVF